MTHRFPAAAARVPQLPVHPTILLRIIFSLFAGSLTLASAGCFHSGTKPIENPPNQQQMEAYAEQQSALRNDVSNPTAETQQTCDQLATATPGVEELRINQGNVESRQWTLVGNGSDHHWVFVRAPDASGGGWARSLASTSLISSRPSDLLWQPDPADSWPTLRSKARASERAIDPPPSERCSALHKGSFRGADESTATL